MNFIDILGAHGSISQEAFTTCLRVSTDIVIDGGNIIRGLGEEAYKINHIFISHAHLDHIIDIAFLIDNTFLLRHQPLKIYATSKTIEIFKKNIFNWDIWPDFSTLQLPKINENSLEFIEIEFNKEYFFDNGFCITPLKPTILWSAAVICAKKMATVSCFQAIPTKIQNFGSVSIATHPSKHLLLMSLFPTNTLTSLRLANICLLFT